MRAVSDERRFGEHEARSPGPVFDVRTQWNLKHASHGEAANPAEEAARQRGPDPVRRESAQRSTVPGDEAREGCNPS